MKKLINKIYKKYTTLHPSNQIIILTLLLALLSCLVLLALGVS